MNKKNYIITFSLLDKYGNEIISGSIKAIDKTDKLDAVMSVSDDFKKAYPQTAATYIRSCVESVTEQPRKKGLIALLLKWLHLNQAEVRSGPSYCTKRDTVKKNFIIDYSCYDQRGYLINSGAVWTCNQVNSEHAAIGAVGFIKGAYLNAVKVVVHGCREEEQKPRKQAIVVAVYPGLYYDKQ